MKIVALLPMKAHSERVPNKNMKSFCEKPLFHWILDTLCRSKYISSIVINTDSPAIAQGALDNFEKIIIHERPASIQGDFVSMNRIIEHDLSLIEGQHFLQTHCTNPLLSLKTIEKAIELYLSNLKTYDSLFSVTRHQTRLYDADGKPINHDPYVLIRTQDLPPIFEENSNLYIFSKKSFYNAENNRIGKKPQLYEISKIEATDIDEPEDWEIAELMRNRTLIKNE